MAPFKKKPGPAHPPKPIGERKVVINGKVHTVKIYAPGKAATAGFAPRPKVKIKHPGTGKGGH